MKPDAASQPSRASLAALGVAIVVLGVLCAVVWVRTKPAAADPFVAAMNAGKNYLDKGEAARATEAFAKSVALRPAHPDAHLNLANAYLLGGQSEKAIEHAQEVLQLDSSSAAAHYVKGCAHLRLGQFEPAVQSLQLSTQIDPNVAAAFFQLGLGHQQLKQWNEAIAAFQTAISLEPEHPAAHYNLSQALIRAGRQDEANEELQLHQQISAKLPAQSSDLAAFERSVHTQARVPFQLEEPDPNGIAVRFADATREAFAQAGGGQAFQGPVGIVDVKHDGHQDLFVVEGGNNFRLLLNTNGHFAPLGETLPGIAGARYSRCLAGDLQNDRYEDIVMLGPQGSHLFKFATNGVVTEATAYSRLLGLQSLHGGLVDMDFTGKTDLLVVTATNTVQVFRNLGGLLFQDISATSGVPASVTTAQSLVYDDWNNDDLMDLFIARANDPPIVLIKQRGGPFYETNAIPNLPKGSVLATGDLNNDLRVDLLVANDATIECIFNGLTERSTLKLANGPVRNLTLVDYDNDGWLDIIASGRGVQAWRNLGRAGFKDVTQESGLSQLAGTVRSVTAADLDLDGDSDLLADVEGRGLQLWRNDGGNSNLQVKVRLLGNRSNASGLGIRIEVASSGLRATRTVHQLPIEIGVGKHAQLESLNVRWFDLHWNQVDVRVEPQTTLLIPEITLPTGSCPYLYVWDGHRFRFVTDLLGASPLGLPVAAGRYIEADPDEYVWLGDDRSVLPREGDYVLQVTEELREVLYLDEAKLVVVDHPAGTEVYPTDKLMPGRPFPPSELVALRRIAPVKKAVRSDGLDVTEPLQAVDGRMASPVQLRLPQLRGLAERFGITLDFGPLPVDRPLVLGLTGWLRFGGGMANIAASHHQDLPFPFPALELETASGDWEAVDVTFGAPAGKTKRMMVDLSGKLPPGAQRLRLTMAFEIHWDHIALFEKAGPAALRQSVHFPSATDLHWRGFSEHEDWPDSLPLTPKYSQVRENPPWRITPAGWCTRYGDVSELIAKQDDALALLNGGDELTLRFSAAALPEKPEGYVRDFFLYTVGWDKDADFHVAHGTTVTPLPFHGMDDQRYGQEPRPVRENDGWIEEYNTRWVGPRTLDRERAVRLAETGPVRNIGPQK